MLEMGLQFINLLGIYRQLDNAVTCNVSTQKYIETQPICNYCDTKKTEQHTFLTEVVVKRRQTTVAFVDIVVVKTFASQFTSIILACCTTTTFHVLCTFCFLVQINHLTIDGL